MIEFLGFELVKKEKFESLIFERRGKKFFNL